MSGNDNSIKQRNLLLWVAFMAPAIGWSVQLGASYMIAAYACAEDRMWILHSIGAAALALGAIGMACAWRNWKLRRRGEQSERDSGFLASFALLLTPLLFMAIVAGEITNWLLEPCI